MKRVFPLIALLLSTLILSCSTQEKTRQDNVLLSDFADLAKSDFALNSYRIREQIDLLIRADHDTLAPDYRTRSYYGSRANLLWISRDGLDARADTLLYYIERAPEQALSSRLFPLKQMKADLERARTLDFDDNNNKINQVYARLEYFLTKSFLRYTSAQRFGLVEPQKLFNRLDILKQDSARTTYRTLFDIPMQHLSGKALNVALRKIYNDSVAEFLHEVQPQSKLYHQLLAQLNDPNTPASQRPKLQVNLERSRWRLNDYPENHKKYVLVNIPSYMLRAVDKKETLVMRVGSGTSETKTPLLSSKINRMDVNPQWIIPRSIIENSIIRHCGDSAYFARHRYFVRHRRSGKKIPIRQVSWSMLNSPDYLVIQEGGEGNSLGRIIFRFENSHSIYLHDTSTPSFFQRQNRSVSHGCIRVQKPIDLAIFLLDDKDEKTIDKIKYSMSADVSTLGENGRNERKKYESITTDTLDMDRIISHVKVEPAVPVFITYYTIYPDSEGQLQDYADCYGYDAIIWKAIQPWVAR